MSGDLLDIKQKLLKYIYFRMSWNNHWCLTCFYSFVWIQLRRSSLQKKTLSHRFTLVFSQFFQLMERSSHSISAFRGNALKILWKRNKGHNPTCTHVGVSSQIIWWVYRINKLCKVFPKQISKTVLGQKNNSWHKFRYFGTVFRFR